jgi:aspartate kinase
MIGLTVMKFGGTSVQDAEAIDRVVEIISGRRKKDLVLVISAMAGVTDALLELSRYIAERRSDRVALIIMELRARHLAVAHAFSPTSVIRDLQDLFAELETIVHSIIARGELTPCSQDAVVSFGERMSSLIVTAALQARGIASELVDSRDFIITDDRFTSAAPLKKETIERAKAILLPIIEAGGIPVTQGFIGSTLEGVTTTIGRGGSDYSAAIIAASLDAEAIEIWTDVDGLMTADPRVVSDAKRIRAISFAEAAELSYFGAKVLHPGTILPAIERGIPIHIYNSRNPSCEGTLVGANSIPSRNFVKSITFKRGFEPNKAIVCIVGENLKTMPGLASRLFRATEGINVSLINQEPTERNMVLVVNEDEIQNVICSLHHEFFVNADPEVFA